jgi:hypothetical protein
MTLQRIGYWQADLFDDYPLPQEVEGELPEGLRRKLTRHLKRGSLFEQYRGLSWCRYGCKGYNGSKELTDGVWVWPEGLAHYVVKHGITLPPEFVEHVVANAAPERLQTDPLEEPPPIDESLWMRWAAQHRKPGFIRALSEARNAARSTLASLVEEEAAALAAREGLGEESCITAGCSRRVLRETVFCPRCLTERERGMTSIEVDPEPFIRSAPWKLDA